MAQSSNRFSFDTNNALIVTSGGAGGTLDINIANISGNPASLSNPLPVELSDGTNPVGTATNPLNAKPQVRTGTFTVTAGTTPVNVLYADGPFQQLILTVNTTAAVVGAGNGFILGSPLSAPGTFNYPAYIFKQPDFSTGVNPGWVSDPRTAIPMNNGRSISWVIGVAGMTNVRFSMSVAGSGSDCVFSWVATTSPVYLPPPFSEAITNGVAVTDGSITALGSYDLAVASNGGVTAAQAVATSGSMSALSVLRTPAVFRGGQFSAAGQNTIWSPSQGKKVRLMKYKIEVSEDVSISGGPLPLNLAFTEILVAVNSSISVKSSMLGYTHRFVAPAAVIATSGSLYDSGWIDLGNGALMGNANDMLAMGIMTPQTTGAVSPSWTIASNQWEAATVGFKTNGNLGNFKVVQAVNANTVSSVPSLALTAAAFAKGNSIFVFIRYSKVVGGAATITVTDTAGNSYTVTAQVANASDTANGSAICVAYATNIIGNAANVITVNFGTNNAAAANVFAYEYSGMGSGGIDAAQVGTTGNSANPASGAYTPATAGDLIFTFYGTAANQATFPTIGSNFRLLVASNAVTAGSIGVADNFGNGALTTGVVNVIAVGTEE